MADAADELNDAGLAGGAPPETDDEWDQLERRLPSSIPVLHLDGFEGPMDLLLDLAEQQLIDLGKMSILELAVQFAAALEQLGKDVAIERRADWVVLATRLVLLRSRLMFPKSPEEAADADRDAQVQIRRIEEMQIMRAAVAWLHRRPQRGWDVFTRPPPEETRDVGYVALMEACLVVLRGRPATEDFAPVPVYRMVVPDLWRINDAIERIQKLLPDYPQGATLGAFMPTVPEEDSNKALKARAAVASTFAAGLELAKHNALALDQSGFFEPITYHPLPASAVSPAQQRA